MGAIKVSSEIGELQKVVIHEPGSEIEVVTPMNAEELLYNDIIDLKDAVKQHKDLSGALSKICTTLNVRDLLSDILDDQNIRKDLITDLTNLYKCPEVKGSIIDLPSKELAQGLLSGTPKKIDSLTKYLSKSQYALPPTPNVYFTRDAAMVVNDKVVIGSMANEIRVAESVIMNYLYKHHKELKNEGMITSSSDSTDGGTINIEGGDLHILREDTVAIGMGERTSTEAIDYLARELNKRNGINDLFVVSLPDHKAFIHLDMVFSMADRDKCVVYPPLILGKDRGDVYHIRFNKDKDIEFIKPVNTLLDGLKQVGIKLEPIFCGGSERKDQDREQWQSGANCFSVGPGRIFAYARNEKTLREVEKAGIPIVPSKDVVEGKVSLDSMDKFAITIGSSELTRGGGGCRCMTQPILRKEIKL